MKVRYVKPDSEILSVGDDALTYYDSLHNLKAPSVRNPYWPNKIGYESHVYAIKIKGGHISYYVRDPLTGDIFHSPAICYEVIDPRMSRYWHIKHGYVKPKGYSPLGSIFPSTWIAIEEWIKEPRFLEFYVDGREREVSIMEAAAKKIEAEFDSK